MAKVKVTGGIKLPKINRIVNDQLVAELRTEIVRDIKALLQAGRSPVRGWGRFEPYKGVAGVSKIAKIARSLTGERKVRAKEKLSSSKKSVYPYSVMDKYPDKKVRPVNLKLSGEMIDAIEVRPGSGKLKSFLFGGNTVLVGIFDKKQALKAETHNEGTQADKVPQRKFLPTGQDETFVVSIHRKILAIIEKRVSYLLKRR